MSDEDIILSCTNEEDDTQNEGKPDLLNQIMGIKAKFEQELKIEVESKPKIVYTAEDKAKFDIMIVGNKNFENFYQFYNKSNDECTLFTNNTDNEWLPSQPNDSKFTIYLPKHAIRLTSFAIRTSKLEKYGKSMPSMLCLYGYNDHVKRWDVLYYSRTQPLKIGSRYDLKIENGTQDNYYNAFQFYTYTDNLALANFKLYGDLIDDKTCVNPSIFKETVRISYKNMPVIAAAKDGDGLLTQAIKIFGPELLNFVYVVFETGDKKNKVPDVWGCEFDSYYKSKLYKKNKPNIISFYFPNYMVFVDGYQIIGHESPSISNWSIGVSEEYPNEGIITDTHKNAKILHKKIYRYDMGEAKPSRLIRLFGYDKEYSFKKIDFSGIAIPCGQKTLDNITVYKWPYPSSVNKFYENEAPKVEKRRERKESSDDENEVPKIEKRKERKESSDDENEVPKREQRRERKESSDDENEVPKREQRKERKESSDDENEVPKREQRKEAPVAKRRRKESSDDDDDDDSERERQRKARMMKKRRMRRSSSDDSDSPPPRREEKPRPKPQQQPQQKVQPQPQSRPQSQTKQAKPEEKPKEPKPKPKTEFYCMYCGERKSSLSSLKNGRCHGNPGRNHTLFTGDEKGPFYCMYCGESRTSLSALVNGKCQNSLLKHHVAYRGDINGPFVCMFCGTKESNLRRLTNGRCQKSLNGKHIADVIRL